MKTLSVKKTERGFDLKIVMNSYLSDDGVRFLRLLAEPIKYSKLIKAFRKEFSEVNEDDITQEFINVLHELRYSYLFEERYGKDDEMRLTELGKNVLNIINKKS